MGGHLRPQVMNWVRHQARQLCPPWAHLVGMGAGGSQHEGKLMGSGLRVGVLIPDSETWRASNGRKEVAHTASDSIGQACTFSRQRVKSLALVLKSK